MDSLITEAAQALAAGDPLAALNRVALRDDASALALRGIAMAQLGDFSRARVLLKNAARAFGPKEAVARARCIVADAEIALASRDLGKPSTRLETARATLLAHGDRINAIHARYLDVRYLLLTGHIDAAEAALVEFDSTTLPPVFKTVHELAVAGIAMRRQQAKASRAALTRAGVAAREARIPALVAEVETALRRLESPVARLLADGEDRPVLLDAVEALLASNTLIIDACRMTVRRKDQTISLTTRPILFTLARALAEAWPEDAPRDALAVRAFRLKTVDEPLRARLRVEIGRLRAKLGALANITATSRGFMIEPNDMSDVAVLAQPVEDKHANLLALLADGEAWSSASIALALGMS
ncbi:helix-turn-helix domain-containing protein, partial [Hahella sp. HN01]|uniref:helix-turn-helix domain-containing protein n=1 Tax=Hahella sp. HN01 TaxID=2847262 RepID=UPI001C1ED3E1